VFQALLAEQESGTSTKGQTLTEQILQIMETILLEASAQPHDTYKVGFVCNGISYIFCMLCAQIQGRRPFTVEIFLFLRSLSSAVYDVS